MLLKLLSAYLLLKFSFNRHSLRRGSSFTFLTPGPHWDFSLVSSRLDFYFKTLIELILRCLSVWFTAQVSTLIWVSWGTEFLLPSLVAWFNSFLLTRENFISVEYKTYFEKYHICLFLALYNPFIPTSMKIKRIYEEILSYFYVHSLNWVFFLIEKFKNDCRWYIWYMNYFVTNHLSIRDCFIIFRMRFTEASMQTHARKLIIFIIKNSLPYNTPINNIYK